jgi:hypothetical protein
MKFIFSFMLVIFYINTSAQVVFEPMHRDIYDFLSRLSQKGIIELNDQVKPLPRIYIAEKLLEAECDKCLTPLENEELEFHKKDFANEFDFLNGYLLSKKSGVAEKDSKGRIRLFFYNDDLFKINVSPILGIKKGIRDEERLTHFWNGIYLYGYLGNYIGFSFDFRDNTENGKTIDKFKNFTSVTGVNARTNLNIFPYPENKMEYSEVKTTISGNWSWGNFTIGKEFIEWGYGEGGKLVLSGKAPSFPFIRLDINPAKWLSFNYIHAWLSSDIIDSSDIYYSEFGSDRFGFREKYLASHTITLFPLKGLNISLGESIVYSDKIQVLYLMPFMFFRLADHYLSRHYNAAGSNAQLFASVNSRDHLKNTHLYGTLFIDEVTINGLFDAAKQRNQFGFSLGSSLVDLPVNNLKLTLEYTKIYPFVYAHFIPTTTYENAGAIASYTLGHWMGNNADQIYASVNYRFIRGLQATLWGQYIRKGEDGTGDQQQHQQPQPPFLFGLQTNYSYLGFSASYEFIHEFFVKGDFQYMKTSSEQIDKSFIDSNLTEFYFSIYYGM